MDRVGVSAEILREVERYPLPHGVEDAVLNKAQLARALDKSEPTLDRWIGEGMPVREAGTNGRSYQFQLSHCYAWARARDAERAAKEDAADRAVRQLRMQLLGGGVGDSERALSPKERRELYEAEYHWSLMAAKRGELVPVAEVVDVLDGVFEAVRRVVLDMPDRLARDLSLAPSEVQAAVSIADEILETTRTRLAALVEAKRAAGASVRAMAGAEADRPATALEV